INVLEHIEEDRKALSRMKEIVNKGGKICLFVPAFPFAYSQMDSLAGHYRRYVKKDFFDHAQALELKVSYVKYFNSLGLAGWYVNKIKKVKTLNDKNINTQIDFFNKYLVGVSKTLDSLLFQSLGQSLVCILEKQ